MLLGSITMLAKINFPQKIIIGIDPGTTTLGFGIIKEMNKNIALVGCGVIKTPPGEKSSKKLLEIFKNINSLFKKIRPDEIAIERIFFFKNNKTAFQVGEAKGIILLAAENFGIPIYEYTPLEVKQAICSYGRATKNQIQKMVQLILGLKEVPRPDDAADALAIAICHNNYKKILKK